jgi:hypothetical protein
MRVDLGLMSIFYLTTIAPRRYNLSTALQSAQAL